MAIIPYVRLSDGRHRRRLIKARANYANRPYQLKFLFPPIRPPPSSSLAWWSSGARSGIIRGCSSLTFIALLGVARTAAAEREGGGEARTFRMTRTEYLRPTAGGTFFPSVHLPRVTSVSVRAIKNLENEEAAGIFIENLRARRYPSHAARIGKSRYHASNRFRSDAMHPTLRVSEDRYFGIQRAHWPFETVKRNVRASVHIASASAYSRDEYRLPFPERRNIFMRQLAPHFRPPRFNSRLRYRCVPAPH